MLLSDAKKTGVTRIPTGFWDPVFGPAKRCPQCSSEQKPTCEHHAQLNGLADTSVTLLGGIPGVGKTTLFMAVADAIITYHKTERELLLVCSEQAEEEVAEYAERLKVAHMTKIRALSTLVGSEAIAEFDAILEDVNPCATFIDSLSGLVGKNNLEGAVAVAKALKPFAVKRHMPVMLIDHATKEDDLAGSMDLQHEVDTTLVMFKSDQDPDIRVIESRKNRFGRADVQVLMRMNEDGFCPVELGEEEEEDE